MATAARKARKRAGIPFTKAQKTPTPPFERSYVTEAVPGAPTTKYQGEYVRRSDKKVKRFLERFTPAEAAS